MTETNIGFEIQLKLPFDQALERVIQALKAEGFGVLTRIDVDKTIKEKLGEEFRPYTILGACNPPLAFKALSTDPAVGLMLPCNVTVEDDLSGGTMVRIANPEAMMQVGELQGNEALREVATAARTRLERVADDLLIE